MATHEVDQKMLGRLARDNDTTNPTLSAALFQILGISFMLGPRLVSARRARMFLTTDDEDALLLLHQILWLSRTGLQILEELVFPSSERPMRDQTLRIFTVKLRASFYHVLCLFRNEPRLFQPNRSSKESPKAQVRQPRTSPLVARSGNGQRAPTTTPKLSPPKSSTSGLLDSKESRPASSSPGGRTAQSELRDTVYSMASDTSYVTNIFPNDPMVPSPAVGPPPGIARKPISIRNNSHFIIPRRNYLQLASGAFDACSGLVKEFLPGSSPLRLSVILEHCAFLWDCAHDHNGSRTLARRTIRDVYRASDPISDDDFEDSKKLVRVLGDFMRRRSSDNTPRLGSDATIPPAQGTSVDPGAPHLPILSRNQASLSLRSGPSAPSSRPITMFEEDAQPHPATQTGARGAAIEAATRAQPRRPISGAVVDSLDDSVTERVSEAVAHDASWTTTPESFRQVDPRPRASSSTSPGRSRAGSSDTSRTIPITSSRRDEPESANSSRGKRPGSSSDSTPKARMKRNNGGGSS